MRKPFFFAAVVAALFVLPAAAQTPGEAVDAAALNQFYDQWTPQQWNKLEKQLLRAVRGPVGAVDPNIIQSIIYFETHYPEAMELDRAASRLLDVYQEHSDPRVRIMALSALHSISEPQSMVRLARVISFEKSPIARHIGMAAVSDFSKNQKENR